MSTGGDNAAVDLVDEFADLRSRSGGDFFDFFYGVELVAGIDALGGIAGIEVLVEFQSADFLDYRKTLVFGNTGIYCRFVHNNVTRLDNFAYGGRSTIKGSQVGIVVFVNGGRHGYYVEVAVADVVDAGGTLEIVVLNCILKQLVTNFEGGIMSSHKSLTTCGIHVKTNSGILS